MLDLIPGSDRLPAVVGAAWTEDPLWSALVVAVVASATAAAWPWLAARQRRRRFQSLIRRELEEVGPQPRRRTDQPWWSHLTKRFVHEEIFRPQNISENRDFILSMDSSVTYLVSQLWISFEKRDGEQWLHYLDELAGDRSVGSKALRSGAEQWRALLACQTPSDDGPLLRDQRRSDPAPPPELFSARLIAYGQLLELTRSPVVRAAGEGGLSAETLRDWYYREANGLLLSGDALRVFVALRDGLAGESTDAELRDLATALRTELKIDLGTRHPDERHVRFARPLDRMVS